MVDYLIVGAGLYGAVMAERLHAAGKSVLVIDRRDHIAGNVYTEEVEGINVHRYGAHIFHTNDSEVWDYVQRFADFRPFSHSPVANYRGELYSLPFNMNTFCEMWGDMTPEEAAARIDEQRKAAGIVAPGNLEEQAVSLVGTDIYEKLIRGYTEKQWGKPCRDLPAAIIRRLPVRFTFDNNYFNAKYQGIPAGGYTMMVGKMLDGIDVRLGIDYLTSRSELDEIAKTVVYTGPVDEYFGYSLGHLEYRSLRFETEVLEIPDFQGHAVVNYTDAETPWTRIIEHKWFEPDGKDHNHDGDYVAVNEDGSEMGCSACNESSNECSDRVQRTVISRECSIEWKPGEEPYYPVNDEKNEALYAEYRKLAEREEIENNVIFGGRLGEYKYYDMDQVIAAALAKAEEII